MAGRVRVGELEVRFEGDFSVNQLRSLLRLMTELNLACLSVAGPVEKDQQIFGFSAQVERLPEAILSEDLSWYFDE